MNLVARRRLDPEVVTRSTEMAVIDHNGILGIDGSVYGAGGERSDIGSGDIAIARTWSAIMDIADTFVVEDALDISEECLKDVFTIRTGVVREDLKLKVVMNIDRSKINKVDLIVGGWEGDEIGGLIEGELKTGNCDKTSVEAPNRVRSSTDSVEVNVILDSARIGSAVSVSKLTDILVEEGITLDDLECHIEESKL